VAENLKARRVSGGRSPLVYILVGVIVALLAVVAVFLANSPLFREPSANEIARTEILASLDANPGDPNLLMMLAEVEYELGRESDALEHAGQAVANGEETPTIRLRYAMLLLREERVEEAKVELEAELELDDRNAEAHFLLGQVHRELGDLDPAFVSLERALELSPYNGDYRLVYADTLALAGRTAEAEAAYRSVLAVLPDDARAIKGLADIGVSYEPTETPNPHGN
jgi:tetratricopeptide (TPR) repeat protein